MRRVVLLAIGIVIALGLAVFVNVPRVISPESEPSAEPTPLPEGFSLVPPFNPSYPCELQNVDLYDEQLCRSERVTETVVSEGDQVVFIRHDYHLGTGCWTGINSETRELRLCDRDSGEVTTLVEGIISDPLPSPDGEWLAFLVIEQYRQSESDGGSFRPLVYRVRREGMDLQRLNPAGFPAEFVGAQDLRWSADGAWLELELWDGTEDGWHGYRLRADGSGEYEPR